MQMNTTMREITINAKLSLTEFRDEKTQELDLSNKGYGNEEAIIIGALLKVLFSSFLVSCVLCASFLLPPGNHPSNHSPAHSVCPLAHHHRSTTR